MKKINYIMIILIFSAPMIFALIVYFGSDYFSLTSKSNGILITQPINVQHLSMTHLNHSKVNSSEFAKHWWLIYLAPPYCNDNCVVQVGKLRSVQLALTKSFTRVKRLLLLQEGSLTPTELIKAQQDPQLTIDFIKNANDLKQHCPINQEDGIFIMDPLGNIMMCYATKQEPQFILKDLEKLLKASQIG